MQITPARASSVGELAVRRALPTRGRRTVGPWCFLDHLGPATYREDLRYDVAPHPHIGLQTVTWLLEGAMVHRDSLGSEQLIRPGQVNLMSAGQGVVHSEENPGLDHGDLHGVQLWLAQPDATRHGAAAFEHLEDPPRTELDHGLATLLVGSAMGMASPARPDAPGVALELRLARGATPVALDPAFEHALLVVQGEVVLGSEAVAPGSLAYLAPGPDEVDLVTHEPSVALLLGGVPFSETVVMWWNFVARSHEEIARAYEAYLKHDERFGEVDSALARLEVAPPPWFSSRR